MYYYTMQICPSILEYTSNDYFQTIKKLSLFYSYFQLDFTDGIYVKNKTASLDDFIKLIPSYQSLTNHLTFDFHLMIKNYQKEIEKLKKIKNLLKIKNVFIHYDLSPNSSLFTSHFSLFNIGLALNPQDKVDDLAKHYNLNNIPSIQIMSVIPGAQGQPFIPETLKKIEQLRLLSYRSKIFLDGAVNDKTLPIIKSKKYQPDIICPGSFLTKTNNLKKNVNFLIKFL